ncbi:MAG: biotin--[acetyl-CoA-carboxylase] ligase [Actinobacteria bacterium]|nr:biotin--[acetyl-CoA-carboxylase] ligase [Actinomycetota bacterium]
MEPIRRPLDELGINSALKNSYWRVSVVELTGSTQNDLTSRVRSGNAIHGDVLTAEYQSAGRGRLDRSFEVPEKSGLLFSLFIQPKRMSHDWGWLPLLAGQAVVEALEKQIPAKLKWPNDVLVHGKKISGLLAEAIEGSGVVIGIGINVSQNLNELPVSTATSLALEGWADCDRNELLTSILTNFTQLLARWDSGDSRILEEYRAKSATIGQAIHITEVNGTQRASFAHGIDLTGALIIDDGELLTVGDVIHLDPK